MATGINVVYGVVAAVGVAVEALRIVRRLDDGIWRDKASNLRIVIPRAVVVQTIRVNLHCCSNEFSFEKEQPTEKFPETNL